jgi:cellulose synthase/poly-beta-1,6-N-acetylglucosamine synthase-like glycosyltransferase
VKIVLLIWILLQVILALWLLLPFFMHLLHYIVRFAGLYVSPVKRSPRIEKDFNFAAIITAHKDTRFIPPLVDSLLKQRYKNLHIYIVADACDITTLHIDAPGVTLLKPEVDFHAKIKSIQYAVEHFKSQHEALVIFDSDNLVHPDYFTTLNQYFRQGYRAVQTQMLSKNTDSIFAKLDSIGHIYQSFTERQVRMELGLSACILGLGIAIETRLYKEIMYTDGLGGFDKKLQADLVKKIPLLAYAAEAIVFDEKVDDGQTLERQRTRWLFAYFHYWKINWKLFITGLRRFNFNLIYFAFVMLRPPLFISAGAGLLSAIINLFIDPFFSLVWVIILLLFMLNFIWVIATKSSQKGMGRALLHLPAFIFRQVRALLKIRSAGKSFLKTEHHKVIYIDDILKNELL